MGDEAGEPSMQGSGYWKKPCCRKAMRDGILG